MSDCKVNIYVHSKFRNTDETSSNFKVVVPDGLLKVGPNEYFSLDVNCFHMYNTIYQCNTNSNHFHLVFRRSDNSVYMIGDYNLTIGNPNVYDVLSNLQSLLSVYLTLSYDRLTNKFTYYRTYFQDSNYYNMYLKPINSSNFLGLKNNVETLISSLGTLCTNPLNVNSIHAINITMDGDISFKNNNIDNAYGFYQNSDIILQKAIDVPKNGLIKYENIDGGDSFHYLLCNTDRIKYFSFTVYDQDMNVINDLPDYSIHLQFIIHQNDNTQKLLSKLVDYTNHSYLILGYIFEIIQNYIKMFSK